MVTELRHRSNVSAQLYVSALSSAWRNGFQVHEPSVWLQRDPEAEDKMLRDADIAYAVDFRQSLVAGRQWDLQPGSPSDPKGELAVDVGTHLLGSLKRFSESRKILARAFFHGSRFAQIHGTTKRMTIGDGRERWWWVPTSIEDQDKRLFRIVPKTEREQDGSERITAHWDRWSVASAKWQPLTQLEHVHTIRHVYQDEQGTLGYGRALREALAWWWFAKANIFHESTQAAERFAQGILHAKVSGVRDANSNLPNEELVNRWVDTLTNMRSRHVLVTDRDDDITVIQGNGEGHQLLKDMRSELRTAIVTLVLCANLTTSADKGGSYALGEIQENSTAALVQFDREAMEETLTDDLIGCIWWNNYANLVELGITDQRPRFNIKQEKLTDPLQRAQVAQVLHGIGVDLASDDVYEQTGFRKPKPGEDVLAAQSAPALGVGGRGFDLSDPLGANGLNANLGFSKKD